MGAAAERLEKAPRTVSLQYFLAYTLHAAQRPRLLLPETEDHLPGQSLVRVESEDLCLVGEERRNYVDIET